MDKPYFTPDLYKFLRELAKNNNRAWFAKNKPRYEKTVVQPSVRFIKDLRKDLKAVSPYLVADPRPFGGSLFRIYRDTRFSKDKSPYKTNIGMEFWHKRGGKMAMRPGLYLHIAPGESFGGGGVWHPDPKTLSMVRRAIVARPDDWKKVKQSRFKIEGDSLKRPPKGYDKNHPFVKDLMLKDFTAGVRFRDSQVTSPRFKRDFVDAAKKIDPLNRFLAKALKVPW